jgi:hypothetical protein
MGRVLGDTQNDWNTVAAKRPLPPTDATTYNSRVGSGWALLTLRCPDGICSCTAAPEIDAGSAAGALTIIVGALTLLGERLRRK